MAPKLWHRIPLVKYVRSVHEGSLIQAEEANAQLEVVNEQTPKLNGYFKNNHFSVLVKHLQTGTR
jgi:hypothetical protein